MTEQYTNPYLDSSVFIGWLKGEVVNGIDRKRIAEHILTRAANGDFLVHISALTLAEVHKKREHERLTDQEDEEILAFFRTEFIVLIEVNRKIGEQANRFCRTYGLSPVDAIHLGIISQTNNHGNIHMWPCWRALLPAQYTGSVHR